MSAPQPHVRAELVADGAGLADALALRHDVFVVEQGVPPELEADVLDEAPSTRHVVLRGAAGTVVATGRVLAEAGGVAHLGRIAVTARRRGAGLGSHLMAVLAHVAWAEVPHEGRLRLELAAQREALGFYTRCGYHLTDRGPFLDAGIAHRDMVRELLDTPSHVRVEAQRR